MSISVCKYCLPKSQLFIYICAVQHSVKNYEMYKKARKSKPLLHQETEQSREPESEKNQILKQSDRKFKITMFNMLSDLTEKINNRYKQIRNFIKEMKII